MGVVRLTFLAVERGPVGGQLGKLAQPGVPVGMDPSGPCPQGSACGPGSRCSVCQRGQR
jgi:hypothetical protein